MATLIFEYWFPLLGWLLASFWFSTDSFSSGETSQIFVPILTFMFPTLSSQQIEAWHDTIRKLAHIGEYFILAVLAYRALKYEHLDPLIAKLRVGLFVLLAALIDEYHQSLTASRGASLLDVGYDCLGAVWALWLITTYETWRLRSHSIL